MSHGHAISQHVLNGAEITDPPRLDGPRQAAALPADPCPEGSYCIYLGGIFNLNEDPTPPQEPKLSWRSYYFAGGKRIAMREVDAFNDPFGTVTWLLGDHLGSTSLSMSESGGVLAEAKYTPWGDQRNLAGDLPTDYAYTGQREESVLGLMYYVARWYDSSIGHFVQADTVIPNEKNVQAWDRFGFVYNNPLIYVDPDGHDPLTILFLLGAFLFFSQIPSREAVDECTPTTCGNDFVMAAGIGIAYAPVMTSSLLCGDGDCTNEGQMVSAAMDGVSATASNGLEDDLQAASQTGQMSQELIQNLTTVSTQNANSSEVVIGLYNNGAGYTQMGAQQGLTYLNMPDNLYQQFLSNPNSLDFWNINKQFLNEAINAGKSFVLSTPYFEIMNNPDLIKTGIWKEVNYLLQNGFTYVIENGIEKLVPIQ